MSARVRLRISLSALRTTERLLIVLGLTALGSYGFALLQATFYQAYQIRNFERAIREAASHDKPMLVAPNRAEAAASDSVVAKIDIPAIHLSAIILEGASSENLRVGLAHMAETALPEQPGNVVIAGHRDTFFRGLKNVRPNDQIFLQTRTGFYSYHVKSFDVLRPDDSQVFRASKRQALTLITCYPFYFVGPAPDRFAVYAERD